MTSPGASAVTLPFAATPAPGDFVEIAEGIMWLRLPLPYLPEHVNAYLIQDGDRWVAVDAGLFDEATISIWRRVHERLPLSALLVTHWHPDHLGAAGWLCETFDLPLVTTESEYLKGLFVQNLPKDEGDALERNFFLSHGLAPDETEGWVANGRRFMHQTCRLPATYRKISAGLPLRIGGRTFDVMTAGGHSPEEVMLVDRGSKILLCANQIAPKIAPTMAVQAIDPEGDPLAYFLKGLDDIAAVCDADTLLLPGHEAPFRGGAARATELRAHYRRRCDLVEAACRESPRTGDELLAVLFRRRPGPVWVGFMIGEALAYANHLVGKGVLERRIEGGVVRYAARAGRSSPRPERLPMPDMNGTGRRM